MTRYRVLPEQSTLEIDARSNVHPIKTRVTGLDGFVDVELGGDGAIDLTVAPAGELSFPVERLRSGNPLEDRELRKRIDAKRYPVISGVLTGMQTAEGNGSYVVRGDLTFRGVTRSCEDEMNISLVGDDTLRLDGQSSFDIRDFGMEPPRILVLRVEPEVTVRVELFARKE